MRGVDVCDPKCGTVVVRRGLVDGAIDRDPPLLPGRRGVDECEPKWDGVLGATCGAEWEAPPARPWPPPRWAGATPAAKTNANKPIMSFIDSPRGTCATKREEAHRPAALGQRQGGLRRSTVGRR
jgi:hypothetical protein